MEDVFSVAYQQTEDEMDLEYAFFGIFDGHGGKEAALFAKEHLMDNITKQQNFWSENDDLVLKSIREGFLKTQQDMWGDLENWAKTGSGLPSTAGTTASIAFIRRGKIFVGHVGDSAIILGEQDDSDPEEWNAKMLTRDHKPECEIELARIEAAGGKVINKSGVPRVVWNRPKLGHTGPVRRSTPVDEIPFLAVARALGDLWSYNSKQDVFVVSPDPDLHVYTIDISKQRCLILGTDGVWNVLSPEMAVSTVRNAEKNNERHMLEGNSNSDKTQWLNPSKQLVDQAVERWRVCKLRADNTSVVVVMLDPPGPPRAQVLKKQREANRGTIQTKKACDNTNAPPLPPKPQTKPSGKGLAIISRFPNSSKPEEASGKNLVVAKDESENNASDGTSRIIHDSSKTEPTKINVTKPNKPEVKEAKTVPVIPSSSSVDTHPSSSSSSVPSNASSKTDPDIQVNEISSSDSESPSSEPKSNQNKQVPATQKPAQRKSLSRELASLALDSPAPKLPARGRRTSERQNAGVLAPRRRGRSIDNVAAGRDNESDEENGGGTARRQQPPQVQSHNSGVTVQNGGRALTSNKLDEVEAKCDALSNKLRMMERKVADRTDKLSQEVKDIRSKLDVSTPTRVLRSRNGDDTSQAPSSGTKRKRHETEEKSSTKSVKRERTTTWSGLIGNKIEKHQNKVEKQQNRVTRKSTGALALPSKGRRSLNILKK